jgi:hypothetical protein
MTHDVTQRNEEGAAAYRPLTPREREVLDFLLSVETPGVEELRRQADFALARSWDSGCASIDLIVDQERGPRSSITRRPAIEATSKEREDPERIFDLLLWVDDGWLSGIEMVEYGFDRHEDAPDVFPEPSDFEPPLAYRAPNDG